MNSADMIIHTQKPFTCHGCNHIFGPDYSAHEHPYTDGTTETSDGYWILRLGVEVPDERIIVDPETGGKKGSKPVQLHCIPWEALQELGRVYHYGAEVKPQPDGTLGYGDYNFRKGYKWSLSFDAMQRHLGWFWNRQDRDDETGLHHLAHAVWHGFTLLFFSLTGRGTDDRPT